MMSKENRTIVIQVLLVVVTFITTTLAGAEWMYGKPFFGSENNLNWAEITQGLWFSVAFLGILTIHEMGHYLTARYYEVPVTFPFYIPFYLGWPTIGTMGAFIRIKGKPASRKQFFDIGVAGPLAGMLAAIIVLWIGFTTLPEPDYIYTIHPEYEEFGPDYADKAYDDQPILFFLGDNLLFQFFKEYVADPDRLPNKYEIFHYPLILAGYLALFFQALNLIPVGQLDGGHVVYGLFGPSRSKIIFRVVFVAFVFFAGINLVGFYQDPSNLSIFLPLYLFFLFIVFSQVFKDFKPRILLIIWVFIGQFLISRLWHFELNTQVYLLFCLLIGRVLGIDHPTTMIEEPLDMRRRILGWIAILAFVIAFTPSPFNLVVNNKPRTEKPGVEESFEESDKIVHRGMIEVN